MSTMGPIDPEIRDEQDFMDLCRATLTRMRDEVSAMLESGAGEGDTVLDKYTNHTLREFRKQEVKDLSGGEGVPLFFGRLDYPPGEVFDGETDAVRREGSRTRAPDRDLLYIGRRGIRDEHGDPIVLDWRASLSRAFYEASAEEAMGVRVRRRFGFDRDARLTAYEDEPLVGQTTSTGGELLAAEIERPREGPMRDIVATIQPEQMRLVRAPLDRTICIQGAPGTGKTAVGLHRLAYLLFAERVRLRRDGGVAVIGPNRSFLSYIRNVLPALGEVEVSQSTIDDLTGPDLPVTGVDTRQAAAVKGSAVMAEVLRRHLWSRLTEPVDAVEVKHQHRTWRVIPDEQAEVLDDLLGRGITYGAGRELLAQRLAHLILRQMEQGGGATATLDQLRRKPGITRVVRRVWPAVDPTRLVFDLLTDADTLAAPAADLLSPEEQRAILVERPRGVRSMRWSTLDLALIDEVAAMLQGPPKLGHVVVDEAQDLSPMHLRAVARRVAGACTILGDLAQATSPAAVRDWSSVLTHLDRPAGTVEVLDRGYRVPAEIIDFAARLLPHIAPDLTSPRSFRHSPGALRVTRVDPAATLDTVLDACASALGRDGSVGLIAADAAIPGLHGALTAAGLTHTVLGAETAEPERLTLVPVTLAKGLEYDAVLLLEPADIVAAEPRGLQRLYVALTRAVSTLQVVHAEPLPAALTEDDLVAL